MTNGIRQPPRPPPAHHPAQPPPPARPGHPPALHQGGEPGAREAQAEPEPAPSSPQAVNAQQRPAGTRGEPAPEDARQSQHPAEAERTQGQQGSASPTQPREPGTPAPMQSQRPAKHQSQPHRLHPGSRRSGEGERGRGEKREGAHRKSQHKSAAHHLHPMRPPPRRSTHAASRPSIPGQTASPGERPAPGNSIPLLWSMRNTLDQRRPRYPRGGKARGDGLHFDRKNRGENFALYPILHTSKSFTQTNSLHHHLVHRTILCLKDYSRTGSTQ